MRHNSLRTVLLTLGFLVLLASPIRAQNFPAYVNGSPVASSIQTGDEIPLIRGGATFKIDPAILIGGGSGTVTNALNLANNAIVLGDGGTVGVKTTATGTGVVTALGVNVGSAGAVLLNGGALGTPVSGTATNLTGTAAGLTAGTVTTNANLTGPVTSTGNATAIASGAIALSKIGGEVDGDCVLGAAGVWTAGSCGGASSVSITAATPNIVVTPSPLTGTGTIGTTNIINTPGGASYTVLSGDATKRVSRDNAGAQTDTLPDTGSAGFGVGYQTSIVTKAFGDTLSRASASTINGLTSIKLGAYQFAGLEPISANDWRAILGVPQPATQTGTTFLRDDMSWAAPAGAGTVTNPANLTTNAVVLGGTNGTTDVKTLAALGTSGQVLTSNGAGVAPSFQAAAGGGVGTKIGTCATSSATCSIGTLGSHTHYHLVCGNLIPPTSGGLSIWVNADNTAGHYAWNLNNSAFSSTSDTSIVVEAGNGTTVNNGNFDAWFDNIASTTLAKFMHYTFGGTAGAAALVSSFGSGEFLQTATAITSIQVGPNPGTGGAFQAGSGTCDLYAYD